MERATDRTTLRARARRSLVVAVVAVVAATVLVGLGLGVGPAGAHQPVFVTDADPDPARGPLLEDGALSFAVYGTLARAGDTRGLRTRLKVGDPLVVDLLIPAQSPEQDLPDDALPRVIVRQPDGTERTLRPEIRVRFDEPFSGTSYVRLIDLRETAPVDGVYELTVVARGPARFTLATGVTEGVRGAVTDAEVPPPGGLAGWYTTPPPEATSGTTVGAAKGKAGRGASKARSGRRNGRKSPARSQSTKTTTTTTTTTTTPAR